MRVYNLVTLLVPFLLFLNVGCSITTTPTYIDTSWRPGLQTPNFQIIITNDHNYTVEGSVTKNRDWIIANESSVLISPNGYEILHVSLDPSSLSPGMHDGNINISFNNSESISIPVYLSVENTKNTSCRLIPTINYYITKIQADAKPFTKTFTVMVSKDCKGPVYIQMPMTVGTVLTTEGEKPISITGELSLGYKNPGEMASFDVLFDVEGMQPQTGTYKIIITGIDPDGNQIQTSITFQITVLPAGEVPPEVNITTLPTWEFPPTAIVNQPFTIRVTNVNPNLQPFILPNENLEGEPPEVSGTTYIFKFKPKKTGQITIKYTVYFKGSQIGEVQEKTITVLGSPEQQASSELKFDFYPPPEQWKDGREVSVLCRDKVNNNIVPCIIYLNGKQLEGNTFVVHAGETVRLSATHPNYNTVDFSYTVRLPKLKLEYNPIDPVVGDKVTFVCKSENDEQVECDIYINEEKINGTSYIFSKDGEYNITAHKEGYEDASIKINIEKPAVLLYAPDKLVKGKVAVFRADKEAEYSVKLLTKDNIVKTVAEGKGKKFNFTVDEFGTYYIFLDNRRVKTYEVKGIELPNIDPTTAVIIIIVLIILVSLGKRKKKASRISLVPPSQKGVFPVEK